MDIVDPQQNQQQPQDLLLAIPQGLTVVTEGLDAGDQELFPYNPLNHNYVGNFSPPFMGPATSGTQYFSASEQGFGGGSQGFQGVECEIAEILSSSTSATNSPAALGFPFGQADQNLYPNFSFDGPGFFSS
nr:WRKY53 [Prunus sibirica]